MNEVKPMFAKANVNADVKTVNKKFSPNGKYCCPACRAENTWYPIDNTDYCRTFVCNYCGFTMTFYEE